MAKKPRNRILLTVVFGLELGLLAWSVVVIVRLVDKGFTVFQAWHLPVLAGAMILIYILYLKKETGQVAERVVGEKFRTGALLDALPAAAMLVDDEGTVLSANARAAGALGVGELELAGAEVGAAVLGEIGHRLAAGASGSFVAANAAGKKLRCTATPIGAGAGGAAAAAVSLVILSPESDPADLPARADRPGGAAEAAVERCFEAVVPLLERTGVHLASLAGAFRASSPHEATNSAQLAGVAVRLSQAARRIRLAKELVLIGEGRLKAAFQSQEFDYAELLRALAERARPLFVATGVDLELAVEGKGLAVRADRARMELVLRDLLEVALAMTAAGGRVTVKAAAGESEVEVAVTDTGCGMSHAELEGLFQASGAAPVQEAYTGGVRDGLFVAKEIIEAHGGQLWAESAPGRGTRFSMRIPKA